MNQKGFVNVILIVVGVVILAGIASYFIIGPQIFYQKPEKEVGSFEECAVAGYPVMESYPEQCRTPDGRVFVRNIISQEVAFGSPVTLAIGEQTKFGDGLTITLVGINDSRCKPEVVCIWAGELSPLLRITGGNAGKSLKEIRLGTTRTESATENGYVFSLRGATETTATIIVTKEDAPTTECRKDLDCLAGNLCHKNICVSPIGSECGGLNDITCPAGYECVQSCGPPVSRGDDPPPPYFCQLKGYVRTCPICLAVNTLISTPLGVVPVQQLAKGMPVWTTDKSGKRIPGTITETVKTSVPSTHQVMHLILSDGREILASLGHPTINGQKVGDLSVGDFIDGSRVLTAEKMPYKENYTYDILPSGETGFYWANGILLDSTLH